MTGAHGRFGLWAAVFLALVVSTSGGCVSTPTPAVAPQRFAGDSLDAALHVELAMEDMHELLLDAADSELSLATQIEYRFARAWSARGWLVLLRFVDSTYHRRRDPTEAEVDSVAAERMSFVRRATLFDPWSDFALGTDDPGFSLPNTLPTRVFVLIDQPKEYERAVDEFVHGRYDSAYAHFTLAIKQYRGPADSVPAAYFWYGAMSAARGRHPADAIGDLRVLLDRAVRVQTTGTAHVDVGANAYRYLIGVASERAGRYATADSVFHDVLAHDLGLYMAHAHLATIYEKEGRWADAVHERKVTIELNPDDPTSLLDLGATFARSRRYAAADSVLAEAEKRAPRDTRIWLDRGEVEINLGRTDSGSAELRRFIAGAPSEYSSLIAAAKRILYETH